MRVATNEIPGKSTRIYKGRTAAFQVKLDITEKNPKTKGKSWTFPSNHPLCKPS